MSMTVVRKEFTKVFGKIKTEKCIDSPAKKEYTGIAYQDGKLYIYSNKAGMYTYDQLNVTDVTDNTNWNIKIQYPTVVKKLVDMMETEFIEGADIIHITKRDEGIEINNQRTKFLTAIVEVVNYKTGEYEKMPVITEEPTEYIDVKPQELLELKSIMTMKQQYETEFTPLYSALQFKMENGKLEYYSSDGFRLGQIESESTGTLPNGTYAVSIKYIKQYLKAFTKKSTGKIRISIHEDNMIMQYGNSISVMHYMMSRTGNNVFEKPVDYRLEIDRKKLLNAAETIDKIHDAKDRQPVTIEWNDEKAIITDTKKYKLELPCESITARGIINHRFIVANPKFVIDTLKAFDGKTIMLNISGQKESSRDIHNKRTPWSNVQYVIVKDGRKSVIFGTCRAKHEEEHMTGIGNLSPEEWSAADKAWQEYATEIKAKKEKQLQQLREEKAKQQEEPIKKMIKEKVKIIPVTFAPQEKSKEESKKVEEKPKEKTKKRVTVKKKVKVVKAEPKKEEITQQEEKMQPKKVHVEPKKRVVVKKKVKVTAKRKITVKPQPKTEKSEQKQAITKTMDEITDMLVQYALKHEPTREELTAYATEVLATYNVR